MRLLFIGDVVGRPGREVLRSQLPRLREKLRCDLVIANGENLAGGAGITGGVLNEVLSSGVDLVTSGNHVWDRKEVFEIIDREPALLRPVNLPPETTPGRGVALIGPVDSPVAVINLVGRIFMEPADCPFRCAERELAVLSDQVRMVVIDFHAEATSEKQAMGWFLDGRVSAVIGTHTHVQTADERLLPRGTAFISDVGMTGLYNSVLGMDLQEPLERFLTGLPRKMDITAAGPVLLNAVLLEIAADGRAVSIERVRNIF